jgi:hypothetical protein
MGAIIAQLIFLPYHTATKVAFFPSPQRGFPMHAPLEKIFISCAENPMIDPELRKLVPDHIRDDQIVDYDYLEDARIEKAGDVQLGVHALHSEAPDIFYSRNGGFWIVTRLDPMSKVLPDIADEGTAPDQP